MTVYDADMHHLTVHFSDLNRDVYNVIKIAKKAITCTYIRPELQRKILLLIC